MKHTGNWELSDRLALGLAIIIAATVIVVSGHGDQLYTWFTGWATLLPLLR